LTEVEPESSEYVRPEIEKRQHRRAKLLTQVQCAALNREELMLTRDVSVGGMFLTAKDPFPTNSEVTVSFRLRAGAPPVSSRGKVMYSMRDMGMGVAFIDLSEAAREALQKFVDEVA
jgi:c-di-GMP-binding flagellar brake protein YcgR